MNIKHQITAAALLTVFASTALVPGAALASGASRQKNKNNWRNLAGVGAAVAGYGLLKGNKTATIVGAAGAAYSANRYEQDRKSQSKAKARRDQSRHYRRGY